jgi:hypothetical protein
MTGPGASSGGDRDKRVDLGGADAVPDTPSAAKRQGAEAAEAERRLTPRAVAETKSAGGMMPVVWIIVAIVAIAAAYFFFGT